MLRPLIALTMLGMLASCGGSQKTDELMSDKTLETAMGIEEEDKAPAMTEFVEPDGCLVEIRKKEPIAAENQQYMQATEGAIVQSRMAFGSMCGSALPVEINWQDVFLSAGFDTGEAPGAVGSASETFLMATKPACDGAAGENWRAQVQHVILTPTDQADRVGLCLEGGTLVYRFMLSPGDGTSTAPTADDITNFYAENL